MKTLSVVTVAILLGLSGAALARNDNRNSQQSYTNATGPNPFMPEFSGISDRGYSASAKYLAQHHVVHQR